MPGFMEPAKEVPVKGEGRDSPIIKNQNEPAEAAASIEVAGLALSRHKRSLLEGRAFFEIDSHSSFAVLRVATLRLSIPSCRVFTLQNKWVLFAAGACYQLLCQRAFGKATPNSKLRRGQQPGSITVQTMRASCWFQRNSPRH
jgi:hypothetical protein